MLCWAALKQTLLGAVLIFAIVFNSQVCANSGIDLQLFGHVSVESRWYPENGAYSSQSHHASGFVLEPEFYFESVSGWSFNLVPFFRYDSADPERSHADLREAYFLLFGEIGNSEWELRLGIDRVFWGVVESYHLVDIINQTDLIEHPDEEVELGQFMAHVTWSGEWGAAEFFAMPHHRERTFPGRRGRLRPAIIIDDERPTYESSAEEWHLDFAARYSQSLGAFDIGISVFDGTSREPLLRSRHRDDGLILVPHYEQVRQFGLDVQLTYNSWLFKLEAIHRADSQNLRFKEEDFEAFVIGGEYTFYSILDSAIDFSVLGEWTYDGRGSDATNAFEDDLLIATRLAFNDIQNTEIYASILEDRQHSTNALVIEVNRRISDRWSMNLELLSLFNVDKEDVQIDQTRRDSFIEFHLNYNF